MSEQGRVTCLTEAHIAVITIDNPPMNQLDPSIIDGLCNAFESLLLEKDIRAVILTGAGKAFVAGADIRELKKWTPEASIELNGKGQRMVNTIERFPAPVIAAINGYALGGGLEIALGCDIRIASEKAKLGLPEARLGIIPGYGGTARLPRVISMGNAKKMIFTAMHVTASEALDMGLVQEVVAHESLLDRAMELAETISSLAPLAVQAVKKTLNRYQNASMEESLRGELLAAKSCYASEDSRIGIDAFINKFVPEFTGK